MMAAEFETKEKHKVDIHYLNTDVPCIVEEIDGYYYDHGDDLALAQVLQNQESVYQSLERNSQKDVVKASSSSESETGHKLSEPGTSTGRGESLEYVNIESQLQSDEALARILQEMENQFVISSIDETSGATNFTHSTTNTGLNSSDTSIPVPREDDVDPDNMTYEELQSLEEAIGSESRGLPDELISYLETSTYKTGLFSRKDKHEDCVICCMPYKNRDALITLPCRHHYHSKCITPWLKINKGCPVCKVEVFGS